MIFLSIRHKALRRLAERGGTAGLPAGSVDRLRNMLAFIAAVVDEDELRVPPNWGAHRLTGNRDGVWALTVTRNWRLTFRVDPDGAVVDMDLEDYH